MILLLTIFFSFTLVSAPTKERDWKLAREKNGIVIHTRKAEGKDLHEFKARMKVRASLASIRSLLEDVSAYPEWQAQVGSAEVIEEIGPDERLLYSVLDVPWPFSDRDIVVRSKRTIGTAGQCTYAQTCVNGKLEENEDLVRITEAQGKWQLSPNPDGTVDILYQYYADPAGSLPNWIVDLFIVDAPYKTFTELKEMLED